MICLNRPNGRELTRLKRLLTHVVQSGRVPGLDRLTASQATLGVSRRVMPAAQTFNASRRVPTWEQDGRIFLNVCVPIL